MDEKIPRFGGCPPLFSRPPSLYAADAALIRSYYFVKINVNAQIILFALNQLQQTP